MQCHHYSVNQCLERHYTFRKFSVKVSSTVVPQGKLLKKVSYNNALRSVLYFTLFHITIQSHHMHSHIHSSNNDLALPESAMQPADPTFQNVGLRINCQNDTQLMMFWCILHTMPYNKSDNYIELIINNEYKIINNHLKAHRYTSEKLKTTAYW